MKRRHVYATFVLIAAFVVGIAVAWKQLRAAQARALSSGAPATAPR